MVEKKPCDSNHYLDIQPHRDLRVHFSNHLDIQSNSDLRVHLWFRPIMWFFPIIKISNQIPIWRVHLWLRPIMWHFQSFRYPIRSRSDVYIYSWDNQRETVFYIDIKSHTAMSIIAGLQVHTKNEIPNAIKKLLT